MKGVCSIPNCSSSSSSIYLVKGSNAVFPFSALTDEKSLALQQVQHFFPVIVFRQFAATGIFVE